MVPHPVLGGGPMNVAIAAARLGAPAAFVGGVSTDEYGQRIMDHLTANGVAVDAVQSSDRPTARAIVEYTPDLVFRFEGEDTADTMLGPVNLTGLPVPPTIVHGGTLGMFRGKTAESLATLAAEHRGIVSVDPNVRPQIIDDRASWDHYHERWLAVAHIYKASDQDLAWIWPGDSEEACVERLLQRGVNVVVITRGSDGLVVFGPSLSATAPAPSIEVVDTVGAGDTAIAAVLVGLLDRGVTDAAGLERLTEPEWKTIAEGATEAAAITCSRAGANPPDRSEVSW